MVVVNVIIIISMFMVSGGMAGYITLTDICYKYRTMGNLYYIFCTVYFLFKCEIFGNVMLVQLKMILTMMYLSTVKYYVFDRRIKYLIFVFSSII